MYTPNKSDFPKSADHSRASAPLRHTSKVGEPLSIIYSDLFYRPSTLRRTFKLGCTLRSDFIVSLKHTEGRRLETSFLDSAAVGRDIETRANLNYSSDCVRERNVTAAGSSYLFEKQQGKNVIPRERLPFDPNFSSAGDRFIVIALGRAWHRDFRRTHCISGSNLIILISSPRERTERGNRHNTVTERAEWTAGRREIDNQRANEGNRCRGA